MDDHTRTGPPTDMAAHADSAWPLVIAVAVVLALMAAASLSLDYGLACL